jgi:hypothetical protein
VIEGGRIMNPLNFYKHPDILDYEKDIDIVGRDLIKQINQTDYMRTIMYCSGHFKDEQEYPWIEKRMELCMLCLDHKKAYIKMMKLGAKLYISLGKLIVSNNPYSYYDLETDTTYWLVDLVIDYDTKEERLKIIDIIKEIIR